MQDVVFVRLRLKISIGEDGAATLFSLHQGGQTIPGKIDAATADNVVIEFASLRANFIGRMVCANFGDFIALSPPDQAGVASSTLVARSNMAAVVWPPTPVLQIDFRGLDFRA